MLPVATSQLVQYQQHALFNLTSSSSPPTYALSPVCSSHLLCTRHGGFHAHIPKQLGVLKAHHARPHANACCATDLLSVLVAAAVGNMSQQSQIVDAGSQTHSRELQQGVTQIQKNIEGAAGSSQGRWVILAGGCAWKASMHMWGCGRSTKVSDQHPIHLVLNVHGRHRCPFRKG